MPRYKKMGPSYFLDASIRFKELGTKGLDITLYSKNILDNNDPLPGGEYGAYLRVWPILCMANKGKRG